MATRTRKTAEKTTDIEPVSVEDAPTEQVDEQQDDYQYDDSVNGFEDVSDDDGDDADDDGLSIFMDDYTDDVVTEDDDEDYDYEDDDDLDTGLRIAFDPSAYGGKDAGVRILLRTIPHRVTEDALRCGTQPHQRSLHDRPGRLHQCCCGRDPFFRRVH